MSDQIHFGSFSKAVNGFTSTIEKADLDLFTKENPSMKNGHEFSFMAEMYLSSFTKQKYSTDETEKVCIPPGGGFRIVSLNGMEKSWNNILSFIAVSSKGDSDIEEVQAMLSKLYEATKDAKKKWGEKACFLIW